MGSFLRTLCKCDLPKMWEKSKMRTRKGVDASYKCLWVNCFRACSRLPVIGKKKKKLISSIYNLKQQCCEDGFFFFGWCCVSSYCLCSLVSWELLGSVNWVNLFDVLVFLLLPVSVVEFHSFFGKLFLKMLASIIILESQYAARK